MRAEIAAAALALAYVEAHPVRGAAGAVAADPARPRREPRDRSGDPRQSRADADAQRRARRLASRDDRPHRDAGRSPAARRAAREPADRSRRDQARGSMRSISSSRLHRLREALRRTLAGAPDFLRSLSRLSLDRAGPRDLAAIRDGLAAAGALARILGQVRNRRRSPVRAYRAPARGSATDCGALERDLQATLADDLPLVKRDGGFVRAGASPPLDEARALARREPPRHRRDAGLLRRGDGRPAAQDQAQQRSRLLHRDAAGAGRGAAQSRR